jgi:fucose permease
MDNIFQEYPEYSYRFVIVLLFGLLSFVNGMCWVVVSPIAVPISNAYGVSEAIVSLIPMSYMIIYIFMNFPSNWVLDAKGIKKGIVVGAVLTGIGSAIRCLVSYSFYFVIVGQFVCALGQPFILNAPTKIAVRWFSPKNVNILSF